MFNYDLTKSPVFATPSHAKFNNGLVAHWTFDTDGNIVDDVTGNQYYGVGIIGGHVVGGAQGIVPVNGGPGGAAAINLLGAGGVCSFPNVTTGLITAPFTFLIWVYSSAGNQNPGPVFSYGYNSAGVASGNGMMLYASFTSLNLFIGNTSTAVSLTTSNNTLFANNWHLCGVTWDGTTVNLYNNGLLANSSALSGSIGIANTNCTLIMGCDTRAPINFLFSGNLDDFRWYNRVLSVSEMRDMYSSVFSQRDIFETGLVTKSLVKSYNQSLSFLSSQIVTKPSILTSKLVTL